MSKIKGIYAASMSILNDDLTLDIKKTILHAEMVIDNGCHGAAIFGSTGQAQLIPVSEKINLLNHLTSSKHKEKYIIGTGLNSLGETINLMRVSKSLGASKSITIRRVILPAIMPNILAGMRISMGTAWLVIVAAEMLLGTGIGYFIWNEWNNLSLENIFVAIIIIGFTGFILDQFFGFLQDKFDYSI